MPSFILFLIILAVVLVVVSLGAGLFVMLKGGELNKKYGNRLMQARVLFQGLALLCLGLAWLMSHQS